MGGHRVRWVSGCIHHTHAQHRMPVNSAIDASKLIQHIFEFETLD